MDRSAHVNVDRSPERLQSTRLETKEKAHRNPVNWLARIVLVPQQYSKATVLGILGLLFAGMPSSNHGVCVEGHVPQPQDGFVSHLLP